MDGLGRRIRAAAQERGLTDAEAARRCGLSQSRFSKYILDMNEPGLRTLLQICNALGTTPDKLLLAEKSDQEDQRARDLRYANWCLDMLDDQSLSLAVRMLKGATVRDGRDE
jgi:transcriptional regulator with XRE-family HTH domain